MGTILDSLQLFLLFVAVSFILLVLLLDDKLKPQDDPDFQSKVGSGFVEKAVVEVDKVEGQPIKEDQSVDDEVSKTVGGVGNVEVESFNGNGGVCGSVERLLDEGSSEKPEYGGIEFALEKKEVGVVCLSEKSVEEDSFDNDVDGGLCGNLESLVDESCEKNGFDLAKGEVGVACSQEKNVGEESSGEHWGLRACVENLVDESSEKHEFGEIEVHLVRNNVEIAEIEEIKVSACDGNESDGVSSEELLDEDDDWEGIETTELERRFGAAVAFVGSKNNAVRVASLVSDVKMRLDGLHRIATRGPCLQPQPMAFKISARAKWNAWQQLGNMSAEVAMEQYITLLSECVPGWMQDVPGDFSESQVWEGSKSDLNTLVQNQSEAEGKSKLEELKPDVGS